MAPTQAHYILAIDFGTTKSSATFINRAAPDLLHVIHRYPEDPRATISRDKAYNFSDAQVPTQIKYQGPGADQEAIATNCKWYYEVSRTGINLTGNGLGLALPTFSQTAFQDKRVDKLKFIFDTEPATEAIRQIELRPVIDALKLAGLIEVATDVATHFLAKFLVHVLEQIKLVEQDTPSILSRRTELVLCVPEAWRAQSTMKMHRALSNALTLFKLGENLGITVDNGCIRDLYIVTEAEAAATYVLEKQQQSTGAHNDKSIVLEAGERVIVADLGGGTGDLGTYQISSTQPLRLKGEVTESIGAFCGSSLINSMFRDKLMEVFGEQFPLFRTWPESIQLDHVDKHAMPQFEHRVKRELTAKPSNRDTMLVFELPQPHPQGFIITVPVEIADSNIRGFFNVVLDRVEELFVDQLEKCKNQGFLPDKIILIGGFAASDILHQRVLDIVARYVGANSVSPSVIRASTDEESATAVSRGAVLAALNKKNGPGRSIRCSYGLVRTIEYDEANAGHVEQFEWFERSTLDQILEMKQSITWFLKRGSVVRPGWTWTIDTFHTFTDEPWICEELLYISDEQRESDYHLEHEKNAGVLQVAKLEVDVTHLKPKLSPQKQSDYSRYRRPNAVYWLVKMKLQFDCVGRDVVCRLMFDDPDEGRPVELIRSCFSMAPALQPRAE